MSHAPHRVHTIHVDDDGAFVPEGVNKKVLRAEEFYVNSNGRIILTLSDYYADEYTINMGPESESMLALVRGLTSEKRYCEIKSYVVHKKDKTSFHKPIVKAVNKTFTY